MQVLTVAGSITLTACIIGFVVFIVARVLGWSVTATLALGLGLVPLFARARALGPRGRIYVAVGTACLTPLIVVAAMAVMMEPLEAPLRSFERMLTQWFTFTAPFFLFVLGTPLLALFWPLVGANERPRLDRGLRIAAALSLAAALVLTLSSVIASRRRIEPARWKDSVPIVAEVPPDRFVELPMETVLAEYPGAARAMRAITAHGELSFACVVECSLSFRAPGATNRSRDLPLGNEGSTHRIRLDDRHAIYLVEDAWRTVAFTRDGTELAYVAIAGVRDSLAPPHAWTFAAALGVACAGALLAFARHRRASRDAVAWTEGVVGDDLAIAFPDGRRVVPTIERTQHPAGTRVVVPGIDGTTPTFRTHPTAAACAIEVGTIEDRRREARIEETAYAAWALAVIALTLAPLSVAVAAGILP